MTTKKIGGRTVAITPSVLMRIEQRTGKTCGELFEHIRKIADAASKAKVAGEEDATDAGVRVLRAMADITLTLNYLSGFFNIPIEVVESDYKTNLFIVFGETFEPFMGAVASMTGGSAKLESDEDGEGKTSGANQSPSE